MTQEPTPVHTPEPPPAAPSRGPVRTSERSLAPDLSRGLMLLLIALANTPWYLYGRTTGVTTVHPTDGSGLDRLVQAVIITAIDSRIYPLFAFLFGYGIVQLYSRQRQAGVSDRRARGLLRRRHWWMLAFGAAHAALLWVGDVIGAWALAGLVLTALFFRRTDRGLLIWAGVLFGVMVFMTGLGALGTMLLPEEADAGFLHMVVGINGEENYLISMALRLGFWLVLIASQGLITLVAPIMVLLAFWAARRRILEEPGAHLPLLRRTAIIGIAVGLGGGLPHALHHLGLFGETAGWIFTATQPVTGFFGALGYVALLTLIAHRLRTRPDAAPVRFCTAIGRRSLSNYLGQSVVFAPLLAAWGLGLGASIGSAAVAGIAIAGWLVLGAVSLAWDRRDYRGPAETLLRRLVYRAPRGQA